MLAALVNAIVPVFGLILLGWLAARRNWLPASAPETLNRFVIYLALPALLLISMARADVSFLTEFGFVASFGLGTFGASLLFAFLSRHESIDPTLQCIHCMSASFSNAAYIGIPLILFVFGPDAIAAAIVTCIMTVSVLFAVTIVVIEVRRSNAHQLVPALRKVLISLALNPLLIAPTLGLCLATSAVELPLAVTSMVDLLAGAATPCALLAIGLFLARSPASSHSKNIPHMVWIKLLAHPALVAFFALLVFDIPTRWAWIAIMAAALPVGTGPFMLAHMYQEQATVIARAILISTVCSVFTLSLLIAGLNYMQIV